MNSRPTNWDTIRKRVYRRDNYTCQNCGAKGGPSGRVELHAHHGVPLKKGGSNKLTNLTTYCKSCHNAIHHKSAVASTGKPKRKNRHADGDSAGFAVALATIAAGIGLYVLARIVSTFPYMSAVVLTVFLISVLISVVRNW